MCKRLMETELFTVFTSKNAFAPHRNIKQKLPHNTVCGNRLTFRSHQLGGSIDVTKKSTNAF